jgi:hypothetical protein
VTKGSVPTAGWVQEKTKISNRNYRHSSVKKEAEVEGKDGDMSGTTEVLDSLPLSSLQLVRSELLTRSLFYPASVPLILVRLAPHYWQP